MAIPLIPIAIGAGVVSGGIAISQVIRIKKLKKRYEEARADAEGTQSTTRERADNFKRKGSDLGFTKVQASESLQQAADFLEKAKVKHRNFYVGSPREYSVRLEEITFQAQAFQHIFRTVGGLGVAGSAVGVPAGIYSAVGIFGVASTGTPIVNLSGAAANSAILAAIGRAVGGAGMAAGTTTLSAISTTLNIAALPVSLGTAFWSIKKGNEASQKVNIALVDIASAKKKMVSQMITMDAVIRRMEEVESAVISAWQSLAKQLAISDVGDLEQVHAVFELADLLGKAMDLEVITKEQAAELGIRINVPALEGGK